MPTDKAQAHYLLTSNFLRSPKAILKYIHCANSSPGTEQSNYMQRTVPNANPNSIPVTRRSDMHKLIASTGEEATSALTVGSMSIPPTNHPASLLCDLNVLGCALASLVDPTSSREHDH